MHEDENEHIEPYRILFPLGAVAAIIGVLLWILFQNRWISFYPRQAHANIMFMSFLWSFICGFLMTALPRMTSTFRADFFELFIVILSVFIQIVLNVRNLVSDSIYFFSFQILVLAFFLLRRFIVYKKIPFEGFYFMPFAFLQGLLGIIVFYVNKSDFSSFYVLAGEALVMNLIFGLGSRLIPVISRYPGALMPDAKTPLSNKTFTLTLALVLNGGFLLEVFMHKQAGAVLKLIAIVIMTIKYFRFFKRPSVFNIVAYLLKLAMIALVVSMALSAIGVSTIASLHLIFIGAFVLVTLIVSSRVMLAHGNQNLNYEMKSLRLFIVGVGIFIASVFRYFAQTDVEGLWMNLSVYLFLSVIFIWTHKFIKILVSLKE